eukprot:7388491-Prymnesium_polylepis.1
MLTPDTRLKACYSTDNTNAARTACVQTTPLVTGASYGAAGWPWGGGLHGQLRNAHARGAALQLGLQGAPDVGRGFADRDGPLGHERACGGLARPESGERHAGLLGVWMRERLERQPALQ